MPSDPNTLRMGSPVGDSTLITSAPQSASRAAADGAATHTPSSTTRRPGECRQAVTRRGRSRRATRCRRMRARRRRSSFSTLPVALRGRSSTIATDRGAPCSWPSGRRHHPMMSSPRHLGAGTGHHEGHAHLAEARVGNADHRRLAEIGVAQETVLDLRRVGVEPADDEHVLPAPDDAEAAGLIDHPEVTGAQPTVCVERARRWPPGRRGSGT